LSLGHPQTSARTAAARQPELPGETAQLVYASLVVAQLVLARRFRRDLRWRRWRPWLLAGAAATGVILIAYTAAVTGPRRPSCSAPPPPCRRAAVAAIAARRLRRAGRRGTV
jgi:hypothetical protein